MKAFLILFLTFFVSYIFAQDISNDKIIFQADELFQKGELFESENLLLNVLKKSNKTDLFKAYRLLAQINDELNQYEKADSYAYKLLIINSAYRPNPKGRYKGLIPYINAYRLIPKTRVGININASSVFTIPKIIGSQFVTESYSKNYYGKGSWSVGTQIETNLSEMLGICAEINYSQKSYGFDFNTSKYRVNYEEDLNFLEMPIYIATSFPKGRIIPSIGLGMNVGYLVNASADISETQLLSRENIALSNIGILSRRNRFVYGWTGNVKLRYSVKNGKGVFQLGVEYYNSPVNITKESSRFSNAQLINNYHYLDDNIKINHIRIFGGYSLNLNYKVVKR